MSKKRKQTVLVIATVLCMAGLSFSAQKQYKALEIGQKAPDFNLPAVNGRNYRLADFADADVLVIIFTCNHCPTAQAYEGRIKKLAADYRDKSVALVAISPNDPLAVRLDELGYSDMGDSFEDMKIRAKDMEYNFPYLYDGEDQKVSLAYGPARTPHVYIFDGQRKLRYMGRIDDAEKSHLVKTQDARNAIEALLKGRKVPVEETPTIGCSIKWAEKIESARKSIEQWNMEPVDVEMVDLAAVKKMLANDSDKLRLINIWTTWCGPCVAEFPHLIEINRMYSNRDFEIVTISLDNPDKNAQVLKFLKKNYASTKNYHYSLDDKYKFIETIDKNWQGSIPFTLLIKPGGEVIFKKMGMIEPLELKKTIVEYLGRYYYSK